MNLEHDLYKKIKRKDAQIASLKQQLKKMGMALQAARVETDFFRETLKKFEDVCVPASTLERGGLLQTNKDTLPGAADDKEES